MLTQTALKPSVGARLRLTWLVARQWRTLVFPAPSRPSTSICLLCPLPCNTATAHSGRDMCKVSQGWGKEGVTGSGGNSKRHFTVKREQVPAGQARRKEAGDTRQPRPDRTQLRGRARRAAAAPAVRPGLRPRRGARSLRGGRGRRGPPEAQGGLAAARRSCGLTRRPSRLRYLIAGAQSGSRGSSRQCGPSPQAGPGPGRAARRGQRCPAQHGEPQAGVHGRPAPARCAAGHTHSPTHREPPLQPQSAAQLPRQPSVHGSLPRLPGAVRPRTP